MHRLSVVLLAAGASSRLGAPKQLLRLGDQTLLGHAVEAARGIDPLEVVVVLGSAAEEIAGTLAGKDVSIVHAAHWSLGMGASLAAGIGHLEESGRAGDVLLMVCDQPHVDAGYLQALVHAHYTHAYGIAASAYAGILGVPAIFSRRYLPMLAALPPEAGARQLLHAFREDVLAVDFPAGETDVDTMEDYARLKGSFRF